MSKAAFLMLLLCLSTGFEQHISAETITTTGPAAPTGPISPTGPSSNIIFAQTTHTLPAFTGKITKSKVRMRLQPNLESHIVRELNPSDLVLVNGESDDFYAVEPPADLKAYIYRTFVLDGIVEGNHVNIRLEPDLASPVIAQLNSGDPVNGTILQKDKKWLEISLPSSVRFYVAKEYVQKAGDASLFTSLQKKAKEEKQTTDTTRTENGIIIEKAVAAAPPATPATPPQKAPDPSAPIVIPRGAPVQVSPTATAPTGPRLTVNSKMAQWQDVEQQLFESWIAQNDSSSSIDDFYQDQSEHAITLQGMIEPYHRTVKNKPGDYVLMNASNHLPIAYLYSTQINLQDLVGHEVVIQAIPRDNHNFAYPAYYVISAN